MSEKNSKTTKSPQKSTSCSSNEGVINLSKSSSPNCSETSCLSEPLESLMSSSSNSSDTLSVNSEFSEKLYDKELFRNKMNLLETANHKQKLKIKELEKQIAALTQENQKLQQKPLQIKPKSVLVMSNVLAKFDKNVMQNILGQFGKIIEMIYTKEPNKPTHWFGTVKFDDVEAAEKAKIYLDTFKVHCKDDEFLALCLPPEHI